MKKKIIITPMSIDKKEEEAALIQSLEHFGKSLLEPAFFLTGITGCGCMIQDAINNWEKYFNDDTVKYNRASALLRSLYEAQNPVMLFHYFSTKARTKINIGFVEDDSAETPNYCYALSYCLAKSSCKFKMTYGIKTDTDISLFETFVKGLDDHCISSVPAVEVLKINLSSKSEELNRKMLTKVTFLMMWRR